MKNAIILSLLIVIALLAMSGRDRGHVQALIEDTTLVHRAMVSDGPPLLFAPCQSIPPRNFPRWMERKA